LALLVLLAGVVDGGWVVAVEVAVAIEVEVVEVTVEAVGGPVEAEVSLIFSCRSASVVAGVASAVGVHKTVNMVSSVSADTAPRSISEHTPQPADKAPQPHLFLHYTSKLHYLIRTPG
jgi:hypothetical protein